MCSICLAAGSGGAARTLLVASVLTGEPSPSLLPRCALAGQGCPGQLEAGAHCPGQTDDEYRTEFTMWSIVASPIIVATNIMNMTDIMQEILLNRDMINVRAGLGVHRKPSRTAGTTAC